MLHTPLLGARSESFGEDEMHTPDTEDTAHTTVLGPDVKYVQLADSHTHTHPGAGDCAEECMSYRTGVQPTLPIPDMQKGIHQPREPGFSLHKISYMDWGEASFIFKIKFLLC